MERTEHQDSPKVPEKLTAWTDAMNEMGLLPVKRDV